MKLLRPLFLAAVLIVFSGTSRADADGDVTALVPKLASTDMTVRKAAVDSLQKLAAEASKPGAAAEQLVFAKALALKAGDSSVPKAARVWILRQLQHTGGAAEVKVLAAVLVDKDAELSDCARRALEKNSSAEAVAALREALKKGGDINKVVGLIHSLGERRDSESVPLIAQKLSAEYTAPAAASALGKIANRESVQALMKVADTNKDAVNGLVLAAGKLAARKNRSGPAAIYRRLQAVAKTPKAKAAAMMGVARYAAAAEVASLVQNGFQSTEPAEQAAAAAILKKLDGKRAYPPLAAKLAASLADYPANVKVMLLSSLHGISDGPIIEAAGDADESVRIAAIESLAKNGSANCVPVLLKALSGKSTRERSAAEAALAANQSPEVSRAIAKATGTGEVPDRVNAIKALGMRPNVTGTLIKLAMDEDKDISAAAFKAIGESARESELREIGKLMLAKPNSDASAAVNRIAMRAKDKAAASRMLLGMARSSKPDVQVQFFPALASLGGSASLSMISKAATDDDADMRDRGVRALAIWPDYAATGMLLEIASDTKRSETHHVISMRAIARLLQTSTKQQAQARVTLAQSALKIARRKDEKRELISFLGSVPSSRSAEIVKSYFKDGALKEDAGLAATRIAQGLLASDRSAAHNLANEAKAAKISDAVTKAADAVLKK